MDRNLSSSAEAEICSIIPTDERRVVRICAYTGAGKRISVGVYGYGPKGKEREGECTAHFENIITGLGVRM